MEIRHHYTGEQSISQGTLEAIKVKVIEFYSFILFTFFHLFIYFILFNSSFCFFFFFFFFLDASIGGR